MEDHRIGISLKESHMDCSKTMSDWEGECSIFGEDTSLQPRVSQIRSRERERIHCAMHPTSFICQRSLSTPEHIGILGF